MKILISDLAKKTTLVKPMITSSPPSFIKIYQADLEKLKM